MPSQRASADSARRTDRRGTRGAIRAAHRIESPPHIVAQKPKRLLVMIRTLPQQKLLSFLAAAFLASCVSHKSEVHAGGHWGYEGDDDPAHWCDLDPANTLCCTGKEQSPIDILTARAAPANEPKLE